MSFSTIKTAIRNTAPSKGLLILTSTISLIAGITLSTHLSAADAVMDKSKAEAIMHQRHENFEDIGGSFKTIRDEFKAKTPDMAKIDSAAKTIAKLATELKTWFPEGTGPETGIKTETKAEIWTDKAGFEEAADKFIAASKTFAGLTATGDAKQVMGGMRGLGGACKNCHDKYREEDD
ncbi:MAG: c-type cytochrome [Cellvibrionaceae bacterium]